MIQFREFTKRFGALTAVDHLNLEIAAGEVMALLGPNGSGKTTCLKAAAGLVRPTAGAVLLGPSARAALEPEARQVVSFLPQKVSFPEVLTGADVVEFYRALRGGSARRAEEVLRMAALNGAGDRAVGTYSGGMVQRLGLAVALLPEAPVMLLDEPTAALDPEGLCAFYGLVERRKHEGKTILFSSHQLGDVERLADRFAVLVGGTLAALLSQDQLARRLADRGVLRLRLGPLQEPLLARVRELAAKSLWVHDELIVPGPAALRPAVLDCVRAAGAEILGFTAEEGRLDVLYRELVGGAT
jgi:Cu-processing system ATP-binding protein